MSARLIEAVREHLRKRRDAHEPPPKVTERSARSDLYGGPRTIDVSPRNPPTTTHAPAVGEPAGARGHCEQESGDVGTQSS